MIHMVFNRNVVYSETSEYGKYEVIDAPYNGRPARVLYGSQSTPQSGVARDNNPELLFNYNQRFFEMVMSLRPQKILIIGGGACTLPTALFQRFDDLSIDVVEIDPVLVSIARTFFDVPQSKRLQVHVADGKTYVQQSSTRYDMIIIDAFSGFTIPHHLLEKETLALYRRHLTQQGVVAINFISSYKQNQDSLAHEVIATFKEVFANCSLYQADALHERGEEQNYLLAAGSSPLHFDYLQSEEQDLLL